jgi:hypothetical protein
MPGFVLTTAAVLTCPHGGKVTVVPSQGRVLANNALIATTTAQITVAGCTFTTPCAKVQWANASPRVLVSGQPMLLQAPPAGPGNGMCAPTPAPPIVGVVQPRVTG